MSGGTFDVHTAGGRLILGGNVTATSDTQTATITGPGQVSLGGATRTFTVGNGPLSVDMVIGAIISGTGNEGLFKDGAGLLSLTAADSFTGLTTVHAGTLQVDGSITSS